MTDAEVFKRFIDKYGHKYPGFNMGSNYWDDITKSYLWFKDNVPSGPYTDVMEKYYRAIIEIATIEEFVKRGDLFI